MTRPTVLIHDLATDTITNREMNDEEFAAYEAQQTANAARQTASTG